MLKILRPRPENPQTHSVDVTQLEGVPLSESPGLQPQRAKGHFIRNPCDLRTGFRLQEVLLHLNLTHLIFASSGLRRCNAAI